MDDDSEPAVDQDLDVLDRPTSWSTWRPPPQTDLPPLPPRRELEAKTVHVDGVRHDDLDDDLELVPPPPPLPSSSLGRRKNIPPVDDYEDDFHDEAPPLDTNEDARNDEEQAARRATGREYMKRTRQHRTADLKARLRAQVESHELRQRKLESLGATARRALCRSQRKRRRQPNDKPQKPVIEEHRPDDAGGSAVIVQVPQVLVPKKEAGVTEPGDPCDTRPGMHGVIETQAGKTQDVVQKRAVESHDLFDKRAGRAQDDALELLLRDDCRSKAARDARISEKRRRIRRLTATLCGLDAKVWRLSERADGFAESRQDASTCFVPIDARDSVRETDDISSLRDDATFDENDNSTLLSMNISAAESPPLEADERTLYAIGDAEEQDDPSPAPLEKDDDEAQMRSPIVLELPEQGREPLPAESEARQRESEPASVVTEGRPMIDVATQQVPMRMEAATQRTPNFAPLTTYQEYDELSIIDALARDLSKQQPTKEATDQRRSWDAPEEEPKLEISENDVPIHEAEAIITDSAAVAERDDDSISRQLPTVPSPATSDREKENVADLAGCASVDEVEDSADVLKHDIGRLEPGAPGRRLLSPGSLQRQLAAEVELHERIVDSQLEIAELERRLEADRLRRDAEAALAARDIERASRAVDLELAAQQAATEVALAHLALAVHGPEQAPTSAPAEPAPAPASTGAMPPDMPSVSHDTYDFDDFVEESTPTVAASDKYETSAEVEDGSVVDAASKGVIPESVSPTDVSEHVASTPGSDDQTQGIASYQEPDFRDAVPSMVDEEIQLEFNVKADDATLNSGFLESTAQGSVPVQAETASVDDEGVYGVDYDDSTVEASTDEPDAGSNTVTGAISVAAEAAPSKISDHGIARAGDVTEDLLPDSAINRLPNLLVGARVEAQFGRGDEWYMGRVARIREGGAAVDVEYDDGDTELALPSRFVRFVTEAPVSGHTGPNYDQYSDNMSGVECSREQPLDESSTAQPPPASEEPSPREEIVSSAKEHNEDQSKVPAAEVIEELVDLTEDACPLSESNDEASKDESSPTREIVSTNGSHSENSAITPKLDQEELREELEASSSEDVVEERLSCSREEELLGSLQIPKSSDEQEKAVATLHEPESTSEYAATEEEYSSANFEEEESKASPKQEEPSSNASYGDEAFEEESANAELRLLEASAESHRLRVEELRAALHEREEEESRLESFAQATERRDQLKALEAQLQAELEGTERRITALKQRLGRPTLAAYDYVEAATRPPLVDWLDIPDHEQPLDDHSFASDATEDFEPPAPESEIHQIENREVLDTRPERILPPVDSLDDHSFVSTRDTQGDDEDEVDGVDLDPLRARLEERQNEARLKVSSMLRRMFYRRRLTISTASKEDETAKSLEPTQPSNNDVPIPACDAVASPESRDRSADFSVAKVAQASRLRSGNALTDEDALTLQGPRDVCQNTLAEYDVVEVAELPPQQLRDAIGDSEGKDKRVAEEERAGVASLSNQEQKEGDKALEDEQVTAAGQLKPKDIAVENVERVVTCYTIVAMEGQELDADSVTGGNQFEPDDMSEAAEEIQDDSVRESAEESECQPNTSVDHLVVHGVVESEAYMRDMRVGSRVFDGAKLQSRIDQPAERDGLAAYDIVEVAEHACVEFPGRTVDETAREPQTRAAAERDGLETYDVIEAAVEIRLTVDETEAETVRAQETDPIDDQYRLGSHDIVESAESNDEIIETVCEQTEQPLPESASLPEQGGLGTYDIVETAVKVKETFVDSEDDEEKDHPVTIRRVEREGLVAQDVVEATTETGENLVKTIVHVHTEQQPANYRAAETDRLAAYDIVETAEQMRQEGIEVKLHEETAVQPEASLSAKRDRLAAFEVVEASWEIREEILEIDGETEQEPGADRAEGPLYRFAADDVAASERTFEGFTSVDEKPELQIRAEAEGDNMAMYDVVEAAEETREETAAQTTKAEHHPKPGTAQDLMDAYDVIETADGILEAADNISNGVENELAQNDAVTVEWRAQVRQSTLSMDEESLWPKVSKEPVQFDRDGGEEKELRRRSMEKVRADGVLSFPPELSISPTKLSSDCGNRTPRASSDSAVVDPNASTPVARHDVVPRGFAAAVTTVEWTTDSSRMPRVVSFADERDTLLSSYSLVEAAEDDREAARWTERRIDSFAREYDLVENADAPESLPRQRPTHSEEDELADEAQELRRQEPERVAAVTDRLLVKLLSESVNSAAKVRRRHGPPHLDEEEGSFVVEAVAEDQIDEETASEDDFVYEVHDAVQSADSTSQADWLPAIEAYAAWLASGERAQGLAAAIERGDESSLLELFIKLEHEIQSSDVLHDRNPSGCTPEQAQIHRHAVFDAIVSEYAADARQGASVSNHLLQTFRLPGEPSLPSSFDTVKRAAAALVDSQRSISSPHDENASLDVSPKILCCYCNLGSCPQVPRPSQAAFQRAQHHIIFDFADRCGVNSLARAQHSNDDA